MRIAVREIAVLTGCVKMQCEAESGRKQARPEATHDAGDKKRRHEEEVKRLGA
jgi:hypothetical protein